MASNNKREISWQKEAELHVRLTVRQLMGGGGSNPNSKYLKQKFTNNGGGDYQLDTPIGGGQILQNSDPANSYKYGSKTVFEALPWDSNYNMGEKKYFTTKKAAEDYIRSLMK